MTGVELATLCLIKSTPPSPPTVEADRIPERLGEIERLRAIGWTRLRRRPLGDDEVLEQRAERLGLDRVRMDGHEM